MPVIDAVIQLVTLPGFYDVHLDYSWTFIQLDNPSPCRRANILFSSLCQ